MKQINKYIWGHLKNPNFSIVERLRINKDTGNHHYNYHPKTRDELKSRGFKWSPKNSAWQRKLSPNAIYITKRMFKDIGSLEIKLVNDYTKTI